MIGITGTTGFIGSHVLKRIGEINFPSRLAIREQSRIRAENFPVTGTPELCVCDLLKAETLDQFCTGLTTILHIAGIVRGKSDDEILAVNVQGTENLLKAARRAGVKKFIHISSGAVGVLEGVYADSKEKAEQVVRKSDLEWVILRPSEIYGPGDSQGITSLRGPLEKWPLFPVIGDGNYRLQPLYVNDLVTAMFQSLSLFEQCRSKIITLAGPESLPYKHIVQIYAQALGRKIRTVHVPVSMALLAAALLEKIPGLKITDREQIKRVLISKEWDISIARTLLNFEPHNFEQGISKTLAQISEF